MPVPRPITSWTELPPRYRKAYLVIARRNRASRLYLTDEAADHDAFLMMRQQYWQTARKVVSRRRITPDPKNQ